MIATQPNVYQQAAGAYQGALGATAGMGQVTPNGYAATTAGPAGQVAGTNFAPYMNPYTQNVTNVAMRDMDRARQIAMNDVGAQFQNQGAFGGDRHGVYEAETNKNYFDAVSRMTAGLNQANFGNAQNMALNDIRNNMQQDQFNAMVQNQAGQFNSGQDYNAQLANQRAALDQARTYSGLAGQGFGFGNTLQQQQWQQGLLDLAQQQALLDAGRQQWAGYSGAPAQSLSYLLGPAGMSGGSTTTSTPSVMDAVVGGLGVYGELNKAFS